MATAHKRTLFRQLVGLSKQDDNFHSMMESCASFDELSGGVERSEERNHHSEEAPAKKTAISKRVSEFKKKLGTAKKRDTDISFHGETTIQPSGSGTSRSQSKSPASRRGTGDTESHSDVESVRSEVDDEITVDGISVVSQRKATDDSKVAPDDSTKRKRRSFFSAFMPGSNKTLDISISTRKMEHETHPFNQSISSKQQNESRHLNGSLSSRRQNETHPLNQSLSSNQPSEMLQINESLSSKQHTSPRIKLARGKKLGVDLKRSDAKKSAETPGTRSFKPVRRRKLKDDALEQSNENKRLHNSSRSSSLNQSKELEGVADVLHESQSFELPNRRNSSMQESQRSRLDESQKSLSNVDGGIAAAGIDTSSRPRRSPRSRKRSETESRNRLVSEKRESRRSLSPRRRLKLPSSQDDVEFGDADETGPSVSKDVPPKKRGTSPRRKKVSQSLPSLQEISDVDTMLRKSESHPGPLIPTNDGNPSEQNELPKSDETIQIQMHDVSKTSIRKSSVEQDVGESIHKGKIDTLERNPRGRQIDEQSPRRSRSVAALARARHVPKSRDLSLSPDKQRKGRITREGDKIDRRSDISNGLKDLRSTLEQSPFEKRPRGSSKSLGPGKELSLKNMLDVAAPVGDRKCLTVVSPKDYEKKKLSTNDDGEVVTTEHKAPSPFTSAEGLKKQVRRLSPKKSPSLRHRVTTTPESQKASPRKLITLPTEVMTLAQCHSTIDSKKSPSSSRTRTGAADQLLAANEPELVLENDVRGRARSRVEQLKEENNGVQQSKSRSSSRHRKEKTSAAPNEEQIATETHMAGTFNQSQSSKSSGTTLKKPFRSSSPSKSTKASTTALDDSQRESTIRKSPKPAVDQRQDGFHTASKRSPKSASSPVPDKATALQSQIKISTHSTPEKNDARRLRRPTSKSPGRQASQLQGNRSTDSPKVPGVSKISKRNEQFIRKAMSARNIDGHQTHYFEVEELTKSGTVVKRKFKIVPADDVETVGSTPLHKEASRGAHRHKDGQVFSVAAQLHIPELDESQNNNLKVKYTEYNEISMLDNYADDVEEASESIG